MPEDNILIQIKADVRDIKAKLKTIEGDFSKTTKGMRNETDKLNKKFSGLKTMIAGAFTIGTLYMFKRGLQEVVRVTSNLEEQTAKFETVFRGVMDTANEAVGVLTDLYGMSTREARELMAGTQDLLVPMGMMRDEAAALSFEIVKLATDIGSFNNLPTAQAMEKIKSALVGMYRPMRSVGVVLSATTVEQKALNMGLAASSDELTALHKAVASYTLSLEMSKDAQGDFIRTSDGFANTTKILNAEIEELKSTIGRDLLPVLAELYKRIGEVTKRTTTWIEETQKAMDLGLIEELHERFQESSKKYYDFLVEEQYRLIVAIETEKGAWNADDVVLKMHEEQLRLVQEEIIKTIDKMKDEKDVIVEVKDETIALIIELDKAFEKGKTIQGIYKEAAEEMLEAYKEYLSEWEKFKKELSGQLKPYEEDVNRLNQKFGEGAGEIDNLSDKMDEASYIADRMGDAFGDALADFVKGGVNAEKVALRLIALMLQLAATAWLPPGIGAFVGSFIGGTVGAPAPGVVNTKSYAGNALTTGSARTLSIPVYGRRYIEEAMKQQLNVESISVWAD